MPSNVAYCSLSHLPRPPTRIYQCTPPVARGKYGCTARGLDSRHFARTRFSRVGQRSTLPELYFCQSERSSLAHSTAPPATHEPSPSTSASTDHGLRLFLPSGASTVIGTEMEGRRQVEFHDGRRQGVRGGSCDRTGISTVNTTT